MAYERDSASWDTEMTAAWGRWKAFQIAQCPIHHAAEADRSEALRMIAAGDTNARIMEWFGWSREKVERLRDEALEMARVG